LQKYVSLHTDPKDDDETLKNTKSRKLPKDLNEDKERRREITLEKII
jgi:hypothetical protein